MNDNTINRYLVVNYDQEIFPQAFKQIPLSGELLYNAYRDFFVDNFAFVSGVFVLDGNYYGTVCNYLRVVNRRNLNKFLLGCEGEKKVRILSFDRGANLYDFDFCYVEDLLPLTCNSEDLDECYDCVKDINSKMAGLRNIEALKHLFIGVQDLVLESLSEWIDSNYILFDDDIQKLLFVETDALEALKLIRSSFDRREAEIKIEEEILDKVNEDINKDQREYFLRTQLKIINNELNGNDDIEDYRDSVDEMKAPQSVKDKLFNEINKVSTLSPGSPEAYVIKNYIDLVGSLPWGIYSTENTSIDNARNILNQDHYGIEDVKERVIEFLAIHKLVNHNRGNILCFYGPPGTGKTSIVKSIAKALGRKYVRISLGGMHDEAEIRGHRRTYLGSMPGKIITGMKNAGTMNPVFLMDEIDKLSNDYKGDPASALLEVLDPEQNKGFVDNYLDIPFDLSDVLFVTTANDISRIAKPLLDRMELIEMSSYTTEEKEQIAIRYLIPKQIKENGIPDGIVSFRKSAVTDIILNYTMEAGVRGLEQKIAKICRKIVAKFGDKPFEPFVVTSSKLSFLLGPSLNINKQQRPNEIGVITGLAYTPYGGTTMDIEALLCSGKGELKLTGSLGDVMKESAVQAYSLIKSRAEQYGVDMALFQKDLHINAVECAIPKDGPSAGIALATVMLSALTSKKIRSDIALTGEISLSGRVLPIGGIKEKSMGAINKGIKTIVLPEANKQDVSRLPNTIKSKINYIFVSTIDEVFKVMFDEAQ